MKRPIAQRGLAFFLCAASLASLAGAQETQGQSPDLTGLLNEWHGDHGTTWRIKSDATGYANFLYNGRIASPTTPTTDTEYFQLGRAYMAAAEGLFAQSGETLVNDKVTYLPLGLTGGVDKMTVQFRQEVNGVPVRRGFSNVLMGMGGEMLTVATTGLPNLDGFDTNPTVAQSTARDFAVETFFAETGMVPTYVGDVNLVIDREEVNKRPAATLTWEVRVLATPPDQDPAGFVYTVDAKSARIVSRENSIHHFDVGGQVSTMATPGVAPDTGSNPEVSYPAKYMTVTSSAGTTTTDVNGNFNFPGVSGPLNVTFSYNGTFNNVDNEAGAEYSLVQSLTGTSNNVLMNPTGTALVTAQANAFHWINELRDWTRDINPSDSTADFVADANCNITSTCNAYFDGVSTNYYQAGGGCENTAFSSVVVHEMGHWLNVDYGSGNGADGFGEGNADVFSIYNLDDPIVGQDFCGTGCHVRDANNLRQYCGDGNGGCYGQVHTDGEVLMGALWKVRVNLNTTYGDSAGDAVSNVLFNGWMNAYNQGTIDSVIETQWLTLDDNDGLIENGTPNYSDIDAAFRVQGFPGFDLSIVTFQNVTQVADTQDEVGPYGVAADLTALNAPSVASSELFYRVGNSGPFSSVAMTNPTGSTWVGLIPGVASPARVEYYLEATDSLAASDVYPKGAPGTVLDFTLGVSELYFEDDFETAGDNGWTHAQVATQDDWMHDAPNGASGDPSSAYSGTQVWGNDLAPSGYNGAYQPNVNNYLRSPFIDLSLASGTTLKLQRWLTVEEAIYDQAQIRVNGVIAWENPLNGNLIDTSWNDFELDISGLADGNPVAQLEFRLISDGGLEFGGWNIDDVQLLTLDPTPSACQPFNYGSGLAGTGGVVPGLDSAGQQSMIGNSDFRVTVKNALPGATALIGFGPNSTSAPIFGGTLLVDPSIVFVQVVDLFGQATQSISINNNPALVGKDFFFQSFILDPGAVAGVSMTPGLELTICN